MTTQLLAEAQEIVDKKQLSLKDYKRFNKIGMDKLNIPGLGNVPQEISNNPNISLGNTQGVQNLNSNIGNIPSYTPQNFISPYEIPKRGGGGGITRRTY